MCFVLSILVELRNLVNVKRTVFDYFYSQFEIKTRAIFSVVDKRIFEIISLPLTNAVKFDKYFK